MAFSKVTPSSNSPAPFLMARSMVSLGMDAFLAWSTVMRSLEFISGSAPARAATMISLANLVKMRPLAAAVVSLILVFHCAPILTSSLCLCYHTRLFCQKSYCCFCRQFIDIQLHDAVLVFLIDGHGVVGATATGDYS